MNAALARMAAADTDTLWEATGEAMKLLEVWMTAEDALDIRERLYTAACKSADKLYRED